jgi:hypothetical protein
MHCMNGHHQVAIIQPDRAIASAPLGQHKHGSTYGQGGARLTLLLAEEGRRSYCLSRRGVTSTAARGRLTPVL